MCGYIEEKIKFVFELWLLLQSLRKDSQGCVVSVTSLLELLLIRRVRVQRDGGGEIAQFLASLWDFTN